MFLSTLSLSSSVEEILCCSASNLFSYWCFMACSLFWLVSSSSISFCLMEISEVSSRSSSLNSDSLALLLSDSVSVSELSSSSSSASDSSSSSALLASLSSSSSALTCIIK